MKTKTANAKNTNLIRLRMSGTVSALRSVLSTRPDLLRRGGRVGRGLVVAEIGADRAERFARRRREEHVAETQTRRERARRVLRRAAEDLHAVLDVLQLAVLAQRLRAHLDRGVPAGERADVEDRIFLAEVPDVARLLRETAAQRETARPRRLTAFERGPLAAAGAHGLTLAALAAGLDHAGAVPAPDAHALRTGLRIRLERREREARGVCVVSHESRSFGPRRRTRARSR